MRWYAGEAKVIVRGGMNINRKRKTGQGFNHLDGVKVSSGLG